ncbi:MAG TPA: DUF1499 domain-containing protein [Thermoanaerobaculia bacterium]|nr:DUF1499 domain-containing protein [Thermoanaerobaculia bacterium]
MPPPRTLRPCPKRPNCVSTEALDAGHRMEPLPYRDLAEARRQLLGILGGMPRSKVVEQDETYVHAEFRSAFFRFVDDVELVFDEKAKLLRFRSAARLGYRDFGVNRKRMEEIGKAFKEKVSGR